MGPLIKLFTTDLDGTLTDGGYYVSEFGTLSKRFDTRDFHGLSLLMDRGIHVAIITMATDAALRNQLGRLKSNISYSVGVCDKLAKVQGWISNDKAFADLDWSNVAYIGDDVHDISLLEKVGLAACPMDAHPKVLDCVESNGDGIVMEYCGGKGCVREFADMIIEFFAV